MVPHTLYGMWEPCNVNDLWSPKPYMECRNLVTVNDCYGPPYLIWNDRNLVSVNDCYGPNTLYGMQEPCNCQ